VKLESYSPCAILDPHLTYVIAIAENAIRL